MDTRSSLLSFLKATAKDADDVDLEKDSLVDEGIIDSVSIMKLVDHIEQSFGVKIGDDDLVPENFDTLDDITKLVQSKGGR